ncbi:MAG: pyridoxamine 5'-phosphate oxidase family protein [Nonomuraea sp.]|nr:pyridoxamine 5'-phosphate oxidase family protein [Nonomuraea sp.]
MALNESERQAFLAEPHLAALAVDAGPGRAPLTVPIWYDYTPGGDVEFLTAGDSRKTGLIERAGRLSLLVQRDTPTYRYVSVEGPVVRREPSTVEFMKRLAGRYMMPEDVPGYVEGSDLSAYVTFHMRPARWLSADLGAF